ncbi:MAG: hypothetical protein U0R51_06255 [Solirubrobacterales bacterium]
MPIATTDINRRAACAFLALSVPLAATIAMAGGALAFVPLLLILVPILLVGRPAGVETLERLRSRLERRPPARCHAPAREWHSLQVPGLRHNLLIASSLAERGPPLPALS